MRVLVSSGVPKPRARRRFEGLGNCSAVVLLGLGFEDMESTGTGASLGGACLSELLRRSRILYVETAFTRLPLGSLSFGAIVFAQP